MAKNFPINPKHPERICYQTTVALVVSWTSLIFSRHCAAEIQLWISATVGIFPLLTTFSLITRAGVARMS